MLAYSCNSLYVVVILFIPCRWAPLAAQYPDVVALQDPHHGNQQLTFSQLQQAILQFGAGLHALGLREGDKVSLFSEDSWRWMVADQGIMANGAVDAVRMNLASPNLQSIHIPDTANFTLWSGLCVVSSCPSTQLRDPAVKE
jgi:long-subunit acyl-CoA synthetase (AMP-forming)